VILGTSPYALPSGCDKHVDRAFWLTTTVETGAKFGAIMMADGTALTAGLDQHIAIYPSALANENYNAKDDQGGVWKLLRRLETVKAGAWDGDNDYAGALALVWSELSNYGWYLAQDGVLRYLKSKEAKVGSKKLQCSAGDAVFGAEIRDALTPPLGRVPKEGVDWGVSKQWALAFHGLFAHPDGHQAQVEFGKEHLVHRTKAVRTFTYADRIRRQRSVEALGYTHDVTLMRVSEDPKEEGAPGVMSPEYDLAMCLYQSNSVNAPAVANKILLAVSERHAAGSVAFSQHLIKALGTSSYGRWDDDLEHGRYQRTRAAARASGLWPRSLFDGASALMPKDLEG